MVKFDPASVPRVVAVRRAKVKNLCTKPTVSANLSPTDAVACRTTRSRGPSALPSACDPALLRKNRLFNTKYLPAKMCHETFRYETVRN